MVLVKATPVMVCGYCSMGITELSYAWEQIADGRR